MSQSDQLNSIQQDNKLPFNTTACGDLRILATAPEPNIQAQHTSNEYTSSASGIQAFRDITVWCADLHLPKDVCDLAKQVYKTAAKDGLVSGTRFIRPFAAVCVFLACRAGSSECTLKQIHSATGVNKKVFGQCYYILEKRFNTRGIATAEEDILQAASNMGLRAEVQEACQSIIAAMSQYNLDQGYSRRAVAAAALYFTSHIFGDGCCSGEIIRLSGAGLKVMNAVYQHMCNNQDRLVRMEWIMDGKADLSRLPSKPF